MISDFRGTSTCLLGQEQYEDYYDRLLHVWRCQYDYRTPQGNLFSCVGRDLKDCRSKRDDWLKKNKQ
jgi:hypothetical protein